MGAFKNKIQLSSPELKQDNIWPVFGSYCLIKYGVEKFVHTNIVKFFVKGIPNKKMKYIFV